MPANLPPQYFEVADYPYTTRTAAPFMMPFANIQIQLVDTPPIAPDFMETWLPEIVRVYSKAPGKKADLTSPFALKSGSTVMDMARAVHKDFALNLAFARIWSRGGQIEGLRVQRDHVLADEDVVELHL